MQIGWIGDRCTACAEAWRVVRRIGDAKPEVFRKGRLVDIRADLQILNALRVSEIFLQTKVRQPPRLLQGGWLDR